MLFLFLLWVWFFRVSPSVSWLHNRKCNTMDATNSVLLGYAFLQVVIHFKNYARWMPWVDNPRAINSKNSCVHVCSFCTGNSLRIVSILWCSSLAPLGGPLTIAKTEQSLPGGLKIIYDAFLNSADIPIGVPWLSLIMIRYLQSSLRFLSAASTWPFACTCIRKKQLKANTHGAMKCGTESPLVVYFQTARGWCIPVAALGDDPDFRPERGK